jgi:hypothetical protein
MDDPRALTELQTRGRMAWTTRTSAWVARPSEVIEALAHDGFEEYRREVAHVGADRQSPGGVWQGLNRETGAVASAIWVRHVAVPEALIFINIDGRPVEGRRRTTPVSSTSEPRAEFTK